MVVVNGIKFFDRYRPPQHLELPGTSAEVQLQMSCSGLRNQHGNREAIEPKLLR